MKYIKKFLGEFGFILNRIPYGVETPSYQVEGKLIVEFLGPSGVGKTFYANKLASLNSKRLNSLSLRKKYYKSYKNSINTLEYSSMLLNQFYQSIAILDISPEIKFDIIKNAYNSLRDDFFYFSSNFKSTFISHEGIFCYFKDQIVDIGVEKLNNFQFSSVNRAFILIEDSENNILTKIKKRDYDGFNRLIEVNKTDEDLIVEIKKSKFSYKKLFTYLSDHNFKILLIDACTPLDQNLEKMNDFLLKLENV